MVSAKLPLIGRELQAVGRELQKNLLELPDSTWEDQDLKIKHPGVPQVHDLGRLPDGTPWFVMEYLEGETLLAQLEAAPRRQRRGLDLERVLAIGSNLAAVLVAAHALGIVHREP